MRDDIIDLLTAEDGNASVMVAVLLPVLLWCLLFFEAKMQARWLYTETQSILDISTLGGAQTGEIAATGKHKFVCTIPYDTANQNSSGYHVAVKLLKTNMSALPSSVQSSILQQLNANKISNLKDKSLWAQGYVSAKVTFKYNPGIPLFFRNYVITVESTSKCQPYN